LFFPLVPILEGNTGNLVEVAHYRITWGSVTVNSLSQDGDSVSFEVRFEPNPDYKELLAKYDLLKDWIHLDGTCTCVIDPGAFCVS